MGTAIPFTTRGYTRSNSDWVDTGYFERLYFDSVDDCAMACDARSDCRGFAHYKNDWKNVLGYVGQLEATSKKQCKLMRGKAQGKSGTKPWWWVDGVMYDAGSTPMSAPSGAIKTKSIRAVGDRWDLNRGGTTDNIGNREYCDGGVTYGGPSVYEVGGSGSWDRGRRTCRQVQAGAGACPIPGVVYSVEQDGMHNVKCMYTSMSNAWIGTNWERLPDYFEGDELKKVKRYYCNSLTSSELVNSTKCREFGIQDSNNQDVGFAYNVIDTSTRNPSWYTTSDMVAFVNACKERGTSDKCTGKVSAIKSSDTWTNATINGLNDITYEEVYDTNLSTAVKTKIDEYCPKRSTKPACACSNAVKLGINECEAGIPGCDNLLQFKDTLKKLEGNPKYAALRQTLLDSYTPRKQTPDCKNASLEDSGVLLYGRAPAVGNIEINACIQEVVNNGTQGDIDQKCNITSIRNEATTPTGGSRGTSSGGSGGTPPAEDDDDTDNTYYYLGGGVIFAVSCSFFLILILFLLN